MPSKPMMGCMTAATGGKIGRPSKGVREPLRSKVATPVKRAAEARAQGLGMTLTDYLDWLIRRDTGVLDGQQEDLNFTDAA